MATHPQPSGGGNVRSAARKQNLCREWFGLPVYKQWIKEGKQAVKMTRLACHRFPLESSAARAEPAGVQPGEFVAAAGAAQANRELALTSLQQRLVKTGGRLVQHARDYWLLLAEGHLNRRAIRGDAGPDRTAAGADGTER